MTKILHDIYAEVKSVVESELSMVADVALTCDFWTSRASDAYLGVTAHYITPTWELKSCSLQTREVKERHTAENVAAELTHVVEEWGLQEKVVAISRDNAANMVAAMRIIPWKGLPCFAHTLQIAVRAGLALPAISEILRRCRKVVGHFKHSVVAQNALEESQTRLNLPQHKLVQDVMTRWNSSYNMLKRIIEQETALSAVLAESGKAAHRDMILTSTVVSKIQCIASVLRPLAQATTLLGAEKSPSISLVQHILTALLKKHLQTSDIESKLAIDLKTAIAQSINLHFSDTEQHEMMLISSSLDPRFKGLKFLSSSERASVFLDLHHAAVEYKTTHDVQPRSPPKRPRLDQDLLEYCESSGESENGSSPFESIATAIDKEISQYKSDEQIECSGDLLQWWAVNQHRFPTLSALARHFLTAQATSVPSKRIFSDAGNIVDRKRCVLDPENVDCLVFLHKNM